MASTPYCTSDVRIRSFWDEDGDKRLTIPPGEVVFLKRSACVGGNEGRDRQRTRSPAIRCASRKKRKNNTVSSADLTCTFCALEFSTRSNLNRHVKAKHGDGVRLVCGVDGCDKGYSSQSALVMETDLRLDVANCPT